MIMTREEEIKDAGIRLFGNVSKDINRAFELGAQWADTFPKSPWISVEDRLPEEFQIVFVHMEGGSTDSAIYTNGAFERSLQLKFGMIDDGYTIISWQQKFKSNITHWMPIPQIEKGE